MAVSALQSQHPLTDLVFHSAWVTSHPPHQNPEGTGGGAGLVADGPTLGQVVLGFRLPVADPK